MPTPKFVTLFLNDEQKVFCFVLNLELKINKVLKLFHFPFQTTFVQVLLNSPHFRQQIRPPQVKSLFVEVPDDK